MAGKILITPKTGSTTEDPTIEFQGAGAATNVTLRVPSTGGLSFEGTSGQLFSITDSMSGTIFSANDVSGIPSIEVLDTGLVKLAQYSGNVVLGSAVDDGKKLQVTGTSSYSGDSLYKANARTIYGPNTSWSSYLYVGGDGTNGITRTANLASIVTSNGNIHIDSGSDKSIYLNYYSGTGGIQFGNGGGGIVATVSAAGVFSGNGSALTNLTAGNIVGTVANATAADTVDGQHFDWSNTSNAPTYVWGTNANGSSFLAATGSISVSYAASAGSASTVGGLSISPDRNNTPNKVVRTDASGYLQVGYVNSSNGNENNNTNADRVWGTNGTDDYLRTYRTSALSVNYANSAGSAGSATTATSASTSSSSTKLSSQGTYANGAPGNTRGPNGLNFYECYSNGYPTTYGNILHLGAGGAGQFLVGWSGTDGAHADNYIRSKRDNDTGAWSGWAKIYTDANLTSLPANGGTSTYTNFLSSNVAGTSCATIFENTPAGSVSSRECNGWGDAPNTGWWIVQSHRHTNSGNYWGTQIAYGWEDNSNAIYQRNVSANTWSAWTRVDVSSANITELVNNAGFVTAASPTFTGTVTAPAFSGPLTGNVTGNVSGTAATITGAYSGTLTSGQVTTALGYTPAAAGNMPVSVISTNTTSVSGSMYVLTASLTLTLPASPSLGATIYVSNRSGVATCVIARNGQTIMGIAQDMTLDIDASFQLVFTDTTRGWVLL